MKVKNYTDYIGFRLSSEEKRKFKEYAKGKSWSIGKLIRVAVSNYLIAETRGE